MAKSISIESLSSSVTDSGRRGRPLVGCDCVQCFGYCSVDVEKAQREGSDLGRGGRQARLVATNAPVDLVMAQ